jgi:hypothetical protein
VPGGSSSSIPQWWLVLPREQLRRPVIGSRSSLCLPADQATRSEYVDPTVDTIYKITDEACTWVASGRSHPDLLALKTCDIHFYTPAVEFGGGGRCRPLPPCPIPPCTPPPWCHTFSRSQADRTPPSSDSPPVTDCSATRGHSSGGTRGLGGTSRCRSW